MRAHAIEVKVDEMPEPKSTRPRPEQLARYAELFNNSLVLKYFGARVSFPEGERVEIRIDPIRPEQRGGLGTSAVNGGVLAALFDFAIGVTPALIDPTRRTATICASSGTCNPPPGLKPRAWVSTSSCMPRPGRPNISRPPRVLRTGKTCSAECTGWSISISTREPFRK